MAVSVVSTRADSFQIQAIQHASNSVTMSWQGGCGPFVVETSPNGIDWWDQGDPAFNKSQTLSINQHAAFYRIRDLNPSNQWGELWGKIDTYQGENINLMGSHRLKSQLWFFKPRNFSMPATTAGFLRQLQVVYQRYDDGRMTTFSGPLESLGTVTAPSNAMINIAWTQGTNGDRRQYSFDINSTTTTPATLRVSDCSYEIRCTYDKAQPEFDFSQSPTLILLTNKDTITLYQLAPAETNEFFIRQYRGNPEHKLCLLELSHWQHHDAWRRTLLCFYLCSACLDLANLGLYIELAPFYFGQRLFQNLAALAS